MNLSRDIRPEEELQGKFSKDMLSWLSSDIAGLSLYFANPVFFKLGIKNNNCGDPTRKRETPSWNDESVKSGF